MKPPDEICELTLYIAGATSRSRQALANVKHLCESELKGHYRLVVVDIYKQPELAKRDQIIAVPTLIKRSPEPIKILIGDMSNRERLLAGLLPHAQTP